MLYCGAHVRAVAAMALIRRVARRTACLFKSPKRPFVRAAALVVTDNSPPFNRDSSLWSTPALALLGGGLIIAFGACPPASCVFGDEESGGAAAAAAAVSGSNAAAVSQRAAAQVLGVGAGEVYETDKSSLFTGFGFAPYGCPISAELLKKNFIKRQTEALPGMQREIQSVVLGRAGATDETWRIATKSGQGKKGALTTVTSEIGECAAASFKVKAAELSREARARRPAGAFKPGVVFVDDMPNNHKLMCEIFGLSPDHVIQDLRHLQNRITSTFISVCKTNAKANAAIRDVFTEDFDVNIRKHIRQGLLAGTLPGRVMGTSFETRSGWSSEKRAQWLSEIESDGRFHKAFKSNIPRKMRSVEDIKDKLREFTGNYEDHVDGDGRKLFTHRTKPAIELQVRDKVKFLTEPVFMYLEKGKDTRGLMVWQSFRGTNVTESWHNSVVDFVTGESTGEELANLLLHAGTVRYNANRRRSHKREPDVHHYDRDGLLEVNRQLQRAGRSKRYKVEERRADNGERFFCDKIEAGAGSAAAAVAGGAAASAGAARAQRKKTGDERVWDRHMLTCSGPPVCLVHGAGPHALNKKRGRRHHDARCKFN